MEKETRLTIHSFGGAKLLELCLHWRVWPHVAGLHPALISVPQTRIGQLRCSSFRQALKMKGILPCCTAEDVAFPQL